MNESKEDAQFKRDIAEAIRQSNETFAQTMQQMSMSILQVANGLTRSVEMMSHAILQRPQVLPPAPQPHNFSGSTYAFAGQQEHQLAHQFGEPFRYPTHFFGSHSHQGQNTGSMPLRRNESQNPYPVSADKASGGTESDESKTCTLLPVFK